MAIRVRKIARQLRRSPDDVLEWLHALGFSQYRTPDDMLPAHAAAAVRVAAKRAGPSIPRHAPTPTRVVAGAQSARASSGKVQRGASDPMSALVPGVDRLGGPESHKARKLPDQKTGAGKLAGSRPASVPSSPDAEARHPPAQQESASVSPAATAERQALVQVGAELDARAAQLGADRARLDQERESLQTELQATQQERARLREQLRRAETEPDEASFVVYQLIQRGLRGMDEFERAIGSLADSRQLRQIVELLRCDRPERLSALLQQRLVLTGGEVPEGLPGTLAAISVAPARADLPGKVQLDRALARFGEILLLHGLRRIAVVGGRPAWHKILREGLDVRVELKFPPPPPRTVEQARSDVSRTDLVVLWHADDSPVRDAEHSGYSDGRGIIVVVQGDHVLSLLTAVEEQLRAHD